MDNQIELIKKRIEIADLVSDYVPLKKAGRNYKGLCPFHTEKTPSFMVNPERGVFKCFGCGLGGDVFKFAQEIDNLEFPEALRILAKRAGIELKEYKPSAEGQLREKVLSAQDLAAKFYQTMLLTHDVGKPALEYLKKRGLTSSTIKEWGLGYAPNQWEVVTKGLAAKGFKDNEIVATGLGVSSDKGGRPYDRFRGRIMFPIRDITGRVVGFSGRILGQGEPKYMNSPDSPVYQKSKVLYGMDLAKNAIKKANLAILVEGNVDVLASYQAGVKNTVAPLGTALTADQVGQLLRFTETVALAFDTDLAGDSATKRGIELAENVGLNVRVVHLQGKDPADMVNNSAESWKETVERTTPIYDFYLESAFNKADASSPEGKRKIAHEVLPILKKINDPILRGHYLKLVAERLNVEEKYLEQALARASKAVSAVPKNEATTIAKRSRQDMLEMEIIQLILEVRRRPVILISDDFTEEKLANIYQELAKFFPGNEEPLDLSKIESGLTERVKFDTQSFADKLSPGSLEIFDEILLKLRPEEELDEQVEERILLSSAKELRRSSLKRFLKKLGFMIKEAQANGDAPQLSKLNNKFRELSEKLAYLEV